MPRRCDALWLKNRLRQQCSDPQKCSQPDRTRHLAIASVKIVGKLRADLEQVVVNLNFIFYLDFIIELHLELHLEKLKHSGQLTQCHG